MPSFPVTTSRVCRSTADAVNRRIEGQIERDVAFFAEHPEFIGRRLQALDAEWDIERTLEANAATLALSGTVLGIIGDRRFLALPVPVLRRLGIRTSGEINRERMALKMLRGDFGTQDRATSGNARSRAEAALQAAA